MNKMAKGALATGVGVALLLGGGGTLAIWNDTAQATTGSIVAGDLDLVSQTGTWKNAAGKTIDLSTYKIVPGETLKFEQPITIKLTGDELKATLTPQIGASNGNLGQKLNYVYTIDQNKADISKQPYLTKANNGAAVVNATVTFDQSAGNDLQKATQDLSNIGYNLQQVAP